jgi:hypothetical protein
MENPSFSPVLTIGFDPCTWFNYEYRPGPKVEEASLVRGGVFGLIGSYLDEGLDLRTDHRVS